jgi:hypothetical protein
MSSLVTTRFSWNIFAAGNISELKVSATEYFENKKAWQRQLDDLVIVTGHRLDQLPSR